MSLRENVSGSAKRLHGNYYVPNRAAFKPHNRVWNNNFAFISLWVGIQSRV
jgi:hypothetical protein